MRSIGWFAIGSWFLFLACYLLFAASLGWSELAAGALCASVTLFLVRLLRDKFKRPLLVRPVWFRLLWRIPPAMCRESWQLLVALLRELSGRGSSGCFIEHDYSAPRDEHDAARRAFMTFGVCITPNSYLVRYDAETGKVLVRQLVGSTISKVDRLFVELP